MKKKLICGTLCFVLCLGSAQAAEPTFVDVKEGDWFAPYVTICAETGLMKGTGDGKFTPQGTITVAECAAIAARLGENMNGTPIVYGTAAPGESLPWYHWYVENLKGYGVTVDKPQDPATRREFFDLLSAVTPKEQLTPVNSIDALPDVDAGDPVLDFYNAGILTGVDQYGSFHAAGMLPRAEVAAMVARITDPTLRKAGFVPSSVGRPGIEDQPTVPTPAPGQTPSDAASTAGAVMTVNGKPLSLATLAYWINMMAYQTDLTLATYYNSRLDLTNTALAQSIVEQAKVQAAAQVLMEDKAAQLGCKVDALAATLTPSPSREDLSGFVQLNDLLCAKHILVADLQSAQAVLDGLKAAPTMEQFDALLYVFGTDPGMTSNPGGYLFTAGEMVQEFEDGTRALDIGAYSAEPVQSTYGYHIIWRLDPIDHPDLLGEYQGAALEQQVNTWLQAADIREDSDKLSRIDVAGTYSAFLLQLASGQNQ